MTTTPVETELMHRALQTIEQMLSEIEGPASRLSCASSRMPGYGQPPAQSALYFCLTSASALLDVSRTLLDRLEDPLPHGRTVGWNDLSALSKAAGQSAYLAAVMLSGPEVRNAASARGERALARWPVGARVRATLKSLIRAVPV